MWLEYIIFKHVELLCTQFPLPPREQGFEVYSGSGLECDASHAQLLTCLCQGRKPVKLKPSRLSCSSLLHFFSIGDFSIMRHCLIGDQVAVLFESNNLFWNQISVKTTPENWHYWKLCCKNYCCYLHRAVVYYYSDYSSEKN